MEDRRQRIVKMAGEFVIAPPDGAMRIKRTLSGLAAGAKRSNDQAAYSDYTDALRRLRIPRRMMRRYL